jgi:2'-5' RNA ligase
VPAHLTLLYPFVVPEGLDRSVRAAIQAVAARHAPFSYSLAGQAKWPDTIYVSVDPAEPFVALHGDLAGAFPDYPIYGQTATFDFVPHVTVAEGAAASDPAILASRAWGSLPRRAGASALEVIARVEHAPWRTVWRIELGGHSRSGAR